MPDLRQRVIDAICEEKWPHPDNKVSSASIQERLQSKGDSATVDQVQQVLFQLSDHGNITLMMEPGTGSGPVVQSVDPKLCPPPQS